MKRSKCNLVLANDVVTRNNMIITPEESIYGNTKDRDVCLNELVDIVLMRNNLTYNRTVHHLENSFDMKSTSTTFQKVVEFLIDNGGFIENNGNGFTPGHFCEKMSNDEFVSSQRKANHNNVFNEGLTLVKVLEDKFYSYGKRKPSVGARSQYLLLKDNPDYHCIIHTHNPLKESSNIPTTPQKPYQCGSLECGLNTKNNLKEMCEGIKAVYLEKHGANILFKKNLNYNYVINFIKDNIKLGEKVK